MASASLDSALASQHQPIQLTHNSPKPKTKEHGLALQVQKLQLRVPMSLMEPIGFLPLFTMFLPGNVQILTTDRRSLAFFFRAFRLLEVLAAAAYQLEVGDSYEAGNFNLIYTKKLCTYIFMCHISIYLTYRCVYIYIIRVQ